MTIRYSETEVITAVSNLTRSRLMRFVQAEIVVPVQSDTGPRFGDIDLARLKLLCELSDDFDLDEDSLAVIISLIDQLHTARSDLHGLLAALENETPDVRKRVALAWASRRGHQN